MNNYVIFKRKKLGFKTAPAKMMSNLSRIIMDEENSKKNISNDNIKFSIYLLGDIGMLNNYLKQNVENIEKTIKKDDMIVILGDNFYPSGVISKLDAKWNTFDSIFSKINNPIFSILGNHDYLQNPVCQIRNPNWIMDDFYYKKEFDNVVLYFLDTVPFDTQYWISKENIERIHNDKIELIKQKQLFWLDGELMKNNNKKKIVFGHYPIYSNGVYKSMLNDVHNHLIPLFIKHKINLYVSGHEHNIQYIKKFENHHLVHQVIIGTSSELRDGIDYKKYENSMYDDNFYYFGKLLLYNDYLILQYINIDNEIKYEYKINY